MTRITRGDTYGDNPQVSTLTQAVITGLRALAVRRAGEDQEMTPMSNAAQTVHAFPVSAKGVLVRDGRVLLLKNEREEWELPGGKLELGEDPAVCVAREITEETGLPVTTGPILDAWQYHIREGRDVVIVTYGQSALGHPGHGMRARDHGRATSSCPRVPRRCRPDGTVHRPDASRGQRRHVQPPC
jgi:ADP-ribose pyrophosphatase YjhB (NUDIX family)